MTKIISLSIFLLIALNHVIGQNDGDSITRKVIYIPKNEMSFAPSKYASGIGLEYKRLKDAKRDSVFIENNGFSRKMFVVRYFFQPRPTRSSVIFTDFNVFSASSDSFQYRASGISQFHRTMHIGYENQHVLLVDNDYLGGLMAYVSYFSIIRQNYVLSQYIDTIVPIGEMLNEFSVNEYVPLGGQRTTNYLGLGLGLQAGFNSMLSIGTKSNVRSKPSTKAAVIGGFFNFGFGGEFQVSESIDFDNAGGFLNTHTYNVSFFDNLMIGLRMGLKF